MKKVITVMDQIHDAVSKILPVLSGDERKAWNEQDPKLMEERLRVMAAWIMRRRTNHSQAVIDAGFSDADAIAAYHATSDLVITTGYEPSREKKWIKTGKPWIKFKYRDGSDFDWTK